MSVDQPGKGYVEPGTLKDPVGYLTEPLSWERAKQGVKEAVTELEGKPWWYKATALPLLDVAKGALGPTVGEATARFTGGETPAQAINTAVSGVAGFEKGGPLHGADLAEEKVLKTKVPFTDEPVFGSLVSLGAQAAIPSSMAEKGAAKALSMLPSGSSKLAQVGARAVGTGLGAMPEAMAQTVAGSVLSPNKENTPAKAAVMGGTGAFLLGAGLGTLVGAISPRIPKAGEAPAVVGTLSRADLDEMSRSAEMMFMNPVDPGLYPPDFKIGVLTDIPKKAPTSVDMVVDPGTGQVTALFTNVNAKTGATIEALRIPDVETATKLKSWAIGNGVSVNWSDSFMTSSKFQELRHILDPDIGTGTFSWHPATGKIPEAYGLEPGATGVARKTPGVQETQLVDDYGPPSDWKTDQAEVVIDAEGNVKLRPVQLAETRLPEERGLYTNADSPNSLKRNVVLEDTVKKDRFVRPDDAKTAPEAPVVDDRGVPIARRPLTEERPPLPEFTEANVPGQAILDLDAVAKAVQQPDPRFSSPTLKQRVQKFFYQRGLRGPVDEAALKLAIQASQTVQRASDDLLRATKAKLGASTFDALDRDLYRYFKGEMVNGKRLSMNDIATKHPQLTQEARNFAEKLMQEKTANDARIRELGGIPDELAELRDEGKLDLYLQRRYLAFALPKGRWYQKLQHADMAQTLKEGAQAIADEMVKGKKNKEVSVEAVIGEIEKILRERPDLKTMGSRGEVGRTFSALLEKKNIDPRIRKLMGEIDSGMASIAMSLGTQRGIIARLELMQEVAANPKWSSATRDPATGRTFQVPAVMSNGAARGRWVNQEVYEAIGNVGKIEASSHAFVRELLGVVKGNQVAMGGIGPMLNNLYGNLSSGVLAGGLDVTRPLKSGRSFKKAWQAIQDYRADPTGKTGLGWAVMEARRVGADYFGFGHEEIGSPAARKFIAEVDRAFKDPKNQSMWSLWGAINKAYGSYRNLQGHLGEALDFTDRFFRMQSYMALREKFIADYVARGAESRIAKMGLLNGSGEQAVSEAAARLAARRINQSFWNPTYIAPAFDKIRKGAAGIASPYATAAFETARIYASLPTRMLEEPELALRLAATATLVGTAVGANGLLRQYNDIRDEEVDAARATMTKSKEHYRPLSVAMAWRDAKGRIQLWDVSKMWDPLRYLTGSPDDHWMRRVLYNFATSPVEGGAGEVVARRAATNLGMISPEPDFNNTPPLFSRGGGLAFLRELGNNSLLPGITKHWEQAAKRTGGFEPLGIDPASKYVEPYTAGQTAFRMLGGSNIEPVTPGAGPSMMAKQAEFGRSMSDLDRAMRSIASSNVSPEEKKRRFAVINAERNRLLEQERSNRLLRQAQ